MKKTIKKPLIVSVISFVLLCIGFVVISNQKYNNPNNFTKGTTVNNVDVAGMSVNDAFSLLKNKLNSPILLIENGKTKYNIKNVGTKYYDLSKTQLQKMLKLNHNKKTVTFKFSTKGSQYKQYITNEINHLEINKSRTDGKMSTIVKSNDKFDVTPEVKPNSINIEQLTKSITKNYPSKTSYTINNFYNQFPSNYVGNSKLKSVSEEYNNHLQDITIKDTKISKNVVIDKNQIFKLLDLNENNISVNTNNLSGWVKSNFSKYSHLESYGDSVTSPDGVTHSFDMGQHGTIINYEKLTDRLNKAILDNVNEVQPEVTEVNNKNSINYVAVNLSTQHEYVIKDGQPVVSTGIMSGKTGSNATPTGTFSIATKQSPSVLRGFNDDGSKYASPVNYWEPFNGAIGLHDSPWQPSFVYGNPQYLSSYGSHGCINNPPSIMSQVYANTFVGETVYVY